VFAERVASPIKPRALDAHDGASSVSMLDVLAMAWRERATGLIVCGGVFACGLALAMAQPAIYRAESRVLVRIGEEYVFRPQVGAAGAGIAPRFEELMNAELRIVQSPEVARRVIALVGAQTIAPDLPMGLAEEHRQGRAELTLAKALDATAAPNTPIIHLEYAHAQRALAAEILNTVVEQYLAYRAEVLSPEPNAAIGAEADSLEARAADAEAALSAFLTFHDVADLEIERRALSELTVRLEAERSEAETRRREATARATGLAAAASGERETIELYVDVDAARALAELKTERADLLARYKPDAQPVRDIERRIERMSALAAEAGDAGGASRRGPNPVRQTIETERARMEAEARAQAERAAALTREKAAAEERLKRLRELEGPYAQLERRRSVLAEQARAFATRAEETRSLHALSGAQSDAVRQIERARAPVRGDSMRAAIALGSLVLALALAIAAAIGRGLLRDAFPTSASAARALSEPVLGVAPKQRRRAA
jgi:uncharacterized protein involved in exopolysaccharide biosynthesis